MAEAIASNSPPTMTDPRYRTQKSTMRTITEINFSGDTGTPVGAQRAPGDDCSWGALKKRRTAPLRARLVRFLVDLPVHLPARCGVAFELRSGPVDDCWTTGALLLRPAFPPGFS